MAGAYQHVTFPAWVQKAGVGTVGIILDMSGSVPLHELQQVMLAIADIPPSTISGIALTDTAVKHAGSRDEILSLILNKGIFGGGTDFSKIADDAWNQIGRPQHLALISDGETVAWPARFPVPTTLLLIDRQSAYTTGQIRNWARFKIPACGASTNVKEIMIIDLPALQDMSRGLD